jgi:hypothetical protein
MKSKEEVSTNGKAVFYTVLWPSFRKAAIECGWGLALHGSMASDMDMMAMPWTEDAQPPEKLVEAISDCIGKTVWKEKHSIAHHGKPHGRIVYTISIFSDFYIDLSIMPANTKTEYKPLNKEIDLYKTFRGCGYAEIDENDYVRKLHQMFDYNDMMLFAEAIVKKMKLL